MHIVLAIAGLLIGSILGRHGGWLYGAIAGFAIGAWLMTDKKVKKLQEELTNLKNRVQSYSEVKAEEPAKETTQAAAKTATEEKTPETKQPVAVTEPEEPKQTETTKPA